MRAWTPSTPRPRSRPRISPAARVVKVTASTSVGCVDARRHAVGDAVGDRPGLAGAGAGEHADRATERLGDPALLGIEALEDGLGPGRVEHGNNSWGTMVDTLTSPETGSLPCRTNLDAGGDTPR